MSRHLIKGGCVLTLDTRLGNHPRADVLLDGGVIAEVGPDLRARDAEVVDATDSIVMPGFVDTHRHVSESLFRGAGDAAGTSDPAARLGPHYSADDVYAAGLVGLLGAAEAGVTTVVDWSDLPYQPGHRQAALQAHADSGLRTVLVHAAAAGVEGGDGWRSGLSGPAPVPAAPTSLAAGPRDPSPGDLDRVTADWELVHSLGLRIHSHVGTTPGDAGLVAELGRRGLLGPDVTLVHCTKLGGDDFAAVVSSGASVSLAPSSEMARGLGPPPVQELIDRGIRPGLAVDTEGPGDLFAQMRAVISVQHATLFDLKLAGKGGIPNLLSTRDVIRYATIDGARAVGLGEVTGSLTPGKQGDVIVLRTDLPNIFPVNDPIGAVVWGMDTANLDWVFAGGRPLMRNGVLEGDPARVRELATAARRRVAAASGLLVASAPGGTV